MKNNYNYQIETLNGYREKYTKEITIGDHLMVQNRVRERYLDAVDAKINALKRESNAIENSKSGVEALMYHMYFNGQQPFLSDYDGTPVTNAVKHELYPRYEEILKLNVDIFNRYNVETTPYPQYAKFDVSGEIKKYEHSRWLLFPISLLDIEFIDYDDLKDITFKSLDNIVSKDYRFDSIFLVMPELCQKPSDGTILEWEWKFTIRCVTIKKAR